MSGGRAGPSTAPGAHDSLKPRRPGCARKWGQAGRVSAGGRGGCPGKTRVRRSPACGAPEAVPGRCTWACARARVAWALSLQAVPPPRRATAAAAARPPPVTRGPDLKPGSTARNRFRQRTGSSLVSLTFNVSGIKSCHKPELLKQWGMFTSVILRDYLSVSHSLTT